MKSKDFENIISSDRMRRYVNACGGNEQKGMTLYRYNLTLSGELLKIISCFEVALRNRINRILEPHLGIDWLRNSCLYGGIFDNPSCTTNTEPSAAILSIALPLSPTGNCTTQFTGTGAILSFCHLLESART